MQRMLRAADKRMRVSVRPQLHGGGWATVKLSPNPCAITGTASLAQAPAVDAIIAGMELSHFIKIARGDAPADLLLRGGQVVNVFTGEVNDADVAIADGRIVWLGRYAAEETIDVSGKVLAPGALPAHGRMEPRLLSPPP